MLRRSSYALLAAVTALAVAAVDAPLAPAAPGPGREGTIRLDGPIVTCDTGAVVGRARFRDDNGKQRLELRANAPDAAGQTFTVDGRDFAGPGLPATVTLDRHGRAGLKVKVAADAGDRFEILGPNPAIEVFDDEGTLVASTDPTCGHEPEPGDGRQPPAAPAMPAPGAEPGESAAPPAPPAAAADDAAAAPEQPGEEEEEPEENEAGENEAAPAPAAAG